MSNSTQSATDTTSTAGDQSHSMWDQLKALTQRRFAVIAILGFASGLPLSLVGSSLRAWFTDTPGISIRDIGFATLVGLPYVYKFLWAPLVDRVYPPWLGRRRGWILMMQFCIIAAIFLIAQLDPLENGGLVVALALIIAATSATQDIAYDAYRTELEPKPPGRQLAAGLGVSGYRIGMIASGPIMFYFAEAFGWNNAYTLIGALMLIGIGGTLAGPLPEHQAPKRDSALEPVAEYFSRPFAVTVLAIILFYNLGDAFASSFGYTFSRPYLGFSLTEYTTVYKLVGSTTAAIGAFIGAGLVIRHGLYRCLIWFGWLQLVTNFTFLGATFIGKDMAWFIFTVSVENLSGSMGNAALVGLIMAITHRRYTATQFAMFTALAAVPRVYIGPAAQQVIADIGWLDFYLVSLPLALPGILLVMMIKTRIEAIDKAQTPSGFASMPTGFEIPQSKVRPIQWLREQWSAIETRINFGAWVFGPVWAAEHRRGVYMFGYLLLLLASIGPLWPTISATFSSGDYVALIPQLLSFIVLAILSPIVAILSISVGIGVTSSWLLGLLFLAVYFVLLFMLTRDADKQAHLKQDWDNTEHYRRVRLGYGRAGLFFTLYSLATFASTLF